MIGASLAIALAPLGLRIAVVEAVSRVETQQPSFDDRSTALSRSTQRMYEAMDLCIECKACKAECPSSVDMAKIKFEFLRNSASVA